MITKFAVPGSAVVLSLGPALIQARETMKTSGMALRMAGWLVDHGAAMAGASLHTLRHLASL